MFSGVSGVRFDIADHHVVAGRSSHDFLDSWEILNYSDLIRLAEGNGGGSLPSGRGAGVDSLEDGSEHGE